MQSKISMNRNIILLTAIAAAMALVVGSNAWAQNGKPAADAQGVALLDTVGFWRMFHELKTPLMRTSDGLKPLTDGSSSLDCPTPAPPEGWTAVDFDDSSWVRRPALGAIKAPNLARLALRGKFRVDDLARTSPMRLSVNYQGGIIVYVNGREIARRHLSGNPAAGDAELLAEDYPRQAFLDGKGKLLVGTTYNRWTLNPPKEALEHPVMIGRKLEVDLPRQALRKGINVVAIELIRAPYHQVVDELKPKPAFSFISPYELSWNTCDLLAVRLTAQTASGIQTAAVRPEGFQIWNSNTAADDYDQDFGDPCEPLQPIALVAPRNGVSSGKVVVGSTKPIRDLRGTVSDLKKSAGAIIPASAVKVRYATPWGSGMLVYPSTGQTVPYAATPNLLGALQETPPVEVPLATGRSSRYTVNFPGQPDNVPGAVCPVWVTVKVPRNAAPGMYEGRLTINAQGEKPVTVPLRLEVARYVLPDTQDRRTLCEMIQSPDTLAMEYDLEMWSKEHLELIGRSFSYIGDVGSRSLYIPLIAQSHFGNADSMVRWIDKGNGSYDFDLSLLKQYLDVAQRNMGKPKLVCLHVWDMYMIPTEKGDRGKGDVRVYDHLAKTGSLVGGGAKVTFVDPATGKTELRELPRYDTAEGARPWVKLFAEIRSLMRARGLEETLALGTFPDQWATKEEVAALKDASGGMKWVVHSHMGVGEKEGIYDHLAECRYESRVWRCEFPSARQFSLYGWNQPHQFVNFNRMPGFMSSPCAAWRGYPELTATGNMRGIGRLGGDYWDVLKNPRGARTGTVTQLYPQSSWRNLDPWAAMLAPGSDGPVATTRYEMLREGLQDTEARITIEEALITPEIRQKLGDDLAGRCEALLMQRVIDVWRGNSSLMLNHRIRNQYIYGFGIAGGIWFEGSSWQQNSRELMNLAAEVRAKTER